jgi:hypothetical protein
MGRTYLESLLGAENISEGGGCFDTDSVALKAHLLYVLHLAQGFNMRFDILGGVELDAFTLQGENLGCVRHFRGIQKDER